MANSATNQAQVALFKNNVVRRVMHNGQWHYSVIDVVRSLTDSGHARTYWGKIKERSFKDESQMFPIWVQLKLDGPDGKKYKTDCATRENIWLIIQEIPSPKAMQFKKWFARVFEERIEEEIDPSKAINRGIETYRKQGYSEKWIRTRVDKVIPARNKLTSSWHRRGINNSNEYAALTNTLHKETFGCKVKDHKEQLGLKKKESLRDNLNRKELLALSNAEFMSSELDEQRDSFGFCELKQNAINGGKFGKEVLELMKKRLEQYS